MHMGEGRNANFLQRIVLDLREDAVTQLSEGLHQDA